MGDLSDYVDVSINRPYTVEHFTKAGLLVLSVIPVTQAEKASLKAVDEGASLIQKAGKWFKVKVMGKGNLAKIGDDFGKVGKLVEHPGTKIDWSKLSIHGMERMSQRGVTKEMAESWVKNGKVLSQNNGSKYLFFSEEGAAVVANDGTLVTVIPRSKYDDAYKALSKSLFGR